MELVTTLLIAAGIPTAVVGFCIWLLQRKIDMNQKKADERFKIRLQEEQKREDNQKKHELIIIKSIGANFALSEATAKAVQRIPDARCNGDMHAALNYANKIKHEQKDFLFENGVDNLFSNDGDTYEGR